MRFNLQFSYCGCNQLLFDLPRQLFIIIFFFGQTECQLAQLKLISLDNGGLVMLGLDQVACSMADTD